MKTPLTKSIILLAVTISFLPICARALSVGSLQRDYYAEIVEKGSADFTLLFWNAEESPCHLVLSANPTEGFVVSVFPRDFVLGKSSNEPPYDTSDYVQTAMGTFKTFHTVVTVKTDGAAQGIHEIHVYAVAESLNQGIKITQSKAFTFKVNITEFQPLVKVTNTGSGPEGITGRTAQPISLPKIEIPAIDYRYIFIAMSLLAILAVATAIYRIS
jgi:hypothetical protein